MNFNGLATRSGFSGFVRKTGVDTDPSGVIAATAKWFVRLIALIVAFDALGLPAVSQGLLLWLPNLVVAMVILVIAGLATKTLTAIVRGATDEAGFSNRHHERRDLGIWNRRDGARTVMHRVARSSGSCLRPPTLRTTRPRHAAAVPPDLVIRSADASPRRRRYLSSFCREKVSRHSDSLSQSSVAAASAMSSSALVLMMSIKNARDLVGSPR